MTPERWGRLKTLFAQAVEASTAERQSLFDQVRRDDPEIGRELERMVASHDAAGDFLLEPQAVAAGPDTRRRWLGEEPTPADAPDPLPGATLDVGCNCGELLLTCRQMYPAMSLSGVEINPSALEKARAALPDAELHGVGAVAMPFADESFDCVACIEVLEHIPAERREQALAEMRRVLRPGGRLILRVPHAGLFAWLDPNNFRFRLPGLYRLRADSPRLGQISAESLAAAHAGARRRARLGRAGRADGRSRTRHPLQPSQAAARPIGGAG